MTDQIITPGVSTPAEDQQRRVAADLDEYKFGWHDPDNYVFEPKRGLSREVVEEISFLKSEPEWMRDLRLRAFEAFGRRPMPNWGGDLGGIHFDDIYYFVRATEKQAATWDELPADIKNTYDRLGIPEAEKQRLIAGVAAQYECSHWATRVYTANKGIVAIKEIEPGDVVFAMDEATGEVRPAPVKAAAQTGVRQTYAVHVGHKFKRTFRGTDNHPLLALVQAADGSGLEPRWKTVGELEVGDLLATARDIPGFGESFEFGRLSNTPERFPTRTNIDLMWLLGLWIGDGCSRHDDASRTWRVEFAIPERDAQLRDEVGRVIEEQFGTRVTRPDGWRVTTNSKALVELMAGIGFAGKSLTKRVPGWVYSLPVEERLAFLAGYLDADGYIAPKSHGYNMRLTSGNESLLEDMRELAMLCGLRPGTVKRFESKHPHDADHTIVGYRLSIAGDYDRIPSRNPRRYERMGLRARYGADRTPGTYLDAAGFIGFAPVTAIEEDEIAPVWDIEVDGPHNFVAEGMIVHNSEVVYHKIREDLEEKGVLFLDTDTALREHEDLFREHFTKVIPANDNKFAALNTAVWSGGSFIWVPEGVKVDIPLQAYFRINKENMGQFERTLIIAEPGSYIHYVEGCTAPIYSSDSLHSAVVEIIVKPGARVRYTTIQNWSTNVYNLVTKRAAAYEDATMEWIDGNIGSKLTMKYPSVWLMGRGAKGEVLSVAYAKDGQHQDAGAKMVHHASDTTSNIVSKSISKGTGRTSYRGLVKIEENARRTRAAVKCDALMLDETARSDTYPYMEIEETDATVEHEATVSKLSDDQLFYMRSRGIDEDEATAMIVRGFIEPIARELPMEYAVELNRLIALEMEGAIG